MLKTFQGERWINRGLAGDIPRCSQSLELSLELCHVAGHWLRIVHRECDHILSQDGFSQIPWRFNTPRYPKYGKPNEEESVDQCN